MSDKIIFIKNVPGIVVPSKAHSNDAAYDVIATSEPKIVGVGREDINYWHSIDYIEYETNLIIAPEEAGEKVTAHYMDQTGEMIEATHFADGTIHALALPRSSISKYNLVLSNSVGLIDNGFRGAIKARFKYIMQPEDLELSDQMYVKVNQKKIYQKGDKIFQLRFSTNVDVKFELIDELPLSVRDIGGFGSSGN